MPSQSPIERLLRALGRVLQAMGCRWYLFGAQAVVLWGRPRMSADVDVTLELPPADLDEFLGRMGKAGFELRAAEDPRQLFAQLRVLPFLHRPTQIPLDIVIAGPGLEEQFLERAVLVSVGGSQIPVISPEDLVITKILAGRPKDFDDVLGILKEKATALDRGRIRDTLSLLEEILSQSDLVPAFERLESAARV